MTVSSWKLHNRTTLSWSSFDQSLLVSLIWRCSSGAAMGFSRGMRSRWILRCQVVLSVMKGIALFDQLDNLRKPLGSRQGWKLSLSNYRLSVAQAWWWVSNMGTWRSRVSRIAYRLHNHSLQPHVILSNGHVDWKNQIPNTDGRRSLRTATWVMRPG